MSILLLCMTQNNTKLMICAILLYDSALGANDGLVDTNCIVGKY